MVVVVSQDQWAKIKWSNWVFTGSVSKIGVQSGNTVHLSTMEIRVDRGNWKNNPNFQTSRDSHFHTSDAKFYSSYANSYTSDSNLLKSNSHLITSHQYVSTSDSNFHTSDSNICNDSNLVTSDSYFLTSDSYSITSYQYVLTSDSHLRHYIIIRTSSCSEMQHQSGICIH